MRLRSGVLIAAFACSLFAQTKPEAALDRSVQNRISSFPGTVSIAAKNLATGERYTLRADDPVRTASTIKLAIMVECFYEAAEGKLKWTEPIKVTSEEKVSGSGILQDLSPGDELPIRDLVDLMIVLSDNTATNLILNRIGGNAVNARMQELGMTQTRVMRKILGDGNDLKPFPTGITEEGAKPENKRWGIGRSSPAEMLALVSKLYDDSIVDKGASEEMIAILKRQRDHSGIGRDLKDVTIANKSGALDHLRSDVGIVYTKGGPIAMAITVEGIPEVNWTPDNPGNLLISELSQILLNGLANPR